ncbi:MAG TPA: hypothetical protein VGJ19_19140 [Streptosporangiaceae bacterium]
MTTGAPRRSASAVRAAPAPALITPPPAHSSGRAAAESASDTGASASAPGHEGGVLAQAGHGDLGPPVLLVDRNLDRPGLGAARADVLGSNRPVMVLVVPGPVLAMTTPSSPVARA